MQWLVANHGLHYTALLMTGLINEIKIRHRSTIAYCPWANEKIERLCKEVLRVVQALLSKWKMPATQWPSIDEIVLRVISQSPLQCEEKRKDGHVGCPMKEFTGLTPSPLFLRLMLLKSYQSLQAFKQVKVRKNVDVQKLHEAQNNPHKNIAIRMSKSVHVLDIYTTQGHKCFH